ncbi:homeodomain-like protein [Tanacetum coccineum]
MEEINNFQQEPNETLYQAWERFKELLMKCPQHYLTEMQEVILFYNGLDVPTRQILDSRGAVLTKTAADAKIAIQEMVEYSQKWHNGTSRGRSTKTSDGLAAIQAQLNNLGREIKKVNEKVYAAQVGCEQCKGPHYTKDCPQKEEGNALEEAYYTQFGGPFQGGGYRATAPGYYQRNNANPFVQNEANIWKDTLSKFMSESTKIHEENSNLIKEIRALTDAAIRNQGASIKTLEIQIGQISKLRRNQGDDLMPTIEEGEVIEEFRTRDEDLDTGIDDYPSYCDDDKKIHIDCAHNLKFSCMIGFEFTHANFFPLLYVNMMSRKFHNSIMKNKMVYKGNNVVGALMNVPIFVGTFSVMTDFAVLEDMDAYRDNEMGDIIFGEPFLREVGIKTKRFEGIITLYNGDNEVTYQMVRSHPKFKHHTNEQCNKIPPLLKVSEKDKINGISHAYQKLKGFYKEVLNLGPDFIRVPSMEEWLTREHINVHELE